MKALLVGLAIGVCSQLATAKEVAVDIDQLDFDTPQFQEALQLLAAHDPLEYEELLEDLKDIKLHKKPAGVIGILFDTTEDGHIIITKVMPGGAADEAGIKGGDRIVQVNGGRIDTDDGSGDALRQAMGFFGHPMPGDAISLVVDRNGKQLEKNMVAKARNSDFMVFTGKEKEIEKILEQAGFPGGLIALREPGRAGLEMANLNKGLGKYFGTDRGVLVLTSADDNIYQLQPGDVILDIGGRKAKDPRWVTNLLFTYGAGDELSIGIMRDKKKRTLTLTIPKE
ncbi:PDZ domain-containing protein [bacterium SCSIO 12696]|nr:PDZ domain-containing protein [bacterium SCSIO 12696]